MILRRANAKDLMLTYEWANDPLVREQSFDTQEISLENHSKWFSTQLNSEDSHILIFEQDSIPLGLTRFHLKNDHWVIGITVAPDQRGKALAVPMLTRSCEYLRGISSLIISAYIKRENVASIKSFERAGFEFIKSMMHNHEKSVLYQWK